MAESTFKFDKKALEVKLEKVIQGYLKFSGKPNYNPHVQLHSKVYPLEKQLMAGETTKELSDTIMALKETPEPLNPNYKEPEPVKQPPTGPKG